LTLAAFAKCSCKHGTWLIARGNKQDRFLFALPPRTACGFAKRERRFLSNPPLHGVILAIFENAKNKRKKTGNLFFDFLS
jgi:hypothetical protein